MKTEISRDSHQPERNYSGVYQQQGRMLTDADWNELVEILKDRLSHVLKDVVGNEQDGMGGTPRHNSLKISKNTETDPLSITPGRIYINGMTARIYGNSPIPYDGQLDFPNSPQPLPDDCQIYADVWERTVTHLSDGFLCDAGLNGADTCTRKEVMVQIKWCPLGVDPEQPEANPVKGNGQLTVTLLRKITQPDPCDPCAEQLDVESIVGNYLFRVEVHDVKGSSDDPDEIVLKWSAENGAEQYGLKDEDGQNVQPPAEFLRDDFAYEFFDESCEKHLGVHLMSGFTPKRGELTKGYPDPAPSFQFVRQWDGFCRLIKNGGSWQVADQFDVKTSGSSSVSFTDISAGNLTISLDAQEMVLTLSNTTFVAGDFWLAVVREVEHDAGSVIIADTPPSGITHHYLKLGAVTGGKSALNPEMDRKYAFPPLTRMTRLFIAGGDGQLIIPGQALPQPLRVGVANGEWPVSGATVRFHIESGGGSLAVLNDSKTNEEGIAECLWTPGAETGEKCRIKASVITPGHESDSARDMLPPVYFYSSLVTADKVAYTPGCPDSGGNNLHSLLKADPGVTLDLGSDGYYTLNQALDALICKMGAKHIPYTRTNEDCWNTLVAESGGDPPETVQDAIDTLCADQRGNGCCTITISAGQDLETALLQAMSKANVHICITGGEYNVKKPVILHGPGHITIEGCGEGTVIKAPNSEAALIFENFKSVAVRHLSISSHDLGHKKGSEFDHLNGPLTIRDVNNVTVEDVFLACPAGGKRMATCLTVAHTSRTDSVSIQGCRFNPGHEQIGILLVNAHHARIEDNIIDVSPWPKKSLLKRRMKEKSFQLSIRKMMLSDVVVVNRKIPADKTRNVSIEYEGRSLRFKTPKSIENAWKNVKLQTNLNDRDLIRFVKKEADKILEMIAADEAAGRTGLPSKFKDWFDAEKSNLPAIASQGIVCAGLLANDICISKNSISGVTQGIHIGLSNKDIKSKKPYIAGRLLVHANSIENYLSGQSSQERHGIFIGNFECLHVENNHLKLRTFPNTMKSQNYSGIRVYGYFGDMLQIRGNCLTGYDKGIFARAVGAGEVKDVHLWQVANNLSKDASGGPDLEPRSQYIISDNF